MLLILRSVAIVACSALLAGAVRPLAGQRVSVGALVQLTSETEERLRLDQLLTGGASAGYLIRSASTLSRDSLGSRPSVAFIAPEFRGTWNSNLPYSMNEGPLWSGRGANGLLTTGVQVRAGWLRVIAAPQLTVAENRPFQVIPFPREDPAKRSIWANPFHPPPASIDLPYRFGDQRIERLDAGQSSITIDAPRVSFGVATENVWWGPAARNPILLGSNAPGFLHGFVQTRDGVQTPIGRFDAQWILGALDESDFFDYDSTNNRRSLNGIAVLWTPRADSGLTFGFARTVFATAEPKSFPFRAAFDFARSVGRPNTTLAATPGQAVAGADQIFSLFARWVFPGAGFEGYAEWARFEQPVSFRDFLEYPQHSQGYTVGLQWARPIANGGTLRVHAEGSYLEPDPSQRVRPVGVTYASRTVEQGYTNRGKSLGAPIGVGSSGQWITADYFDSRFRFGAYLERIRWDNATVWEPIVTEAKAEDVSLVGGLRASATWRGMRAELDFAHTVRLDYLFQDEVPDATVGGHRGVDIVSNKIGLTISTRLPR